MRSSALLCSLELATASPAVARLAANRILAGPKGVPQIGQCRVAILVKGMAIPCGLRRGAASLALVNLGRSVSQDISLGGVLVAGQMFLYTRVLAMDNLCPENLEQPPKILSTSVNKPSMTSR